MFQGKPFPIPVVADLGLGPGSQGEDETLDFMPMPRDMGTFRAPSLPEPEALAAHDGALGALQRALATLRRRLAGETVGPVDLLGLTDADRDLVNQVLGEGEVAAQVTLPDRDGSGDALTVQAQESVFAGVWRVIGLRGGRVEQDTLEVGPFPEMIARAARDEGQPLAPLPVPLPEGTMNAPAVLEELRERSRAWGRLAATGAPLPAAHVVNLSLLPLTPGDSALFEQQLGRGHVMVLSRGYGNCRVVNTGTAHVWRVTYFNSQDMIILDTLEVGDVPEVACAAREDLEDSAERLEEVLQWVETA
jgi:hydrogenase-1 operon protein HyaF